MRGVADTKAIAAKLSLRRAFVALAEESAQSRNGIDEVAEFQNYPSGWTTKEPYAIEWDDLVRLYALIRLRKVTTVLEFGCGFSTALMAYALGENERDFGSTVHHELRRINAFQVHAVDDVPHFIEISRRRLPESSLRRVEFMCAPVKMSTFAGRICTEYETLPNVCPDFIYLDGPDQHDVEGAVNGISTRHFDRWPMACDILKIEHFLLPGTLVVVDGRTANARFLKANLQREWRYEHDPVGDVHYFEMIEEPLGEWNRKQIEFCLGADWRAKPLAPDYNSITR
jgi:hypothetical protein